MNFIKTLTKQNLAVLVTAACLLVSMHAGAAISLSLSGRVDADDTIPSNVGFGAKGLYLGPNFDSEYLNSEYKNWSWSDVGMTIESDGDATISGTMTRDYDVNHYGSAGENKWTVTIELTDIAFSSDTSKPGTYLDHSGAQLAAGQYDWGGNVSEQDFMTLAAGTDPWGNAVNGWGFEWQSLSMSLTEVNPNYNTNVPLTGWEGYAMPSYGHDLVAELHYDGAHGLTFEAWYKNPATNSWYDVGDTKALATINSSSIPEPTSLLLLSMGLFGIGATRVRKKT